MSKFTNWLSHAWDAFANNDKHPFEYDYKSVGYISSYKPDRKRHVYSDEKTILNSIYTRIAIDVAANRINHVKIDENGNFLFVVKDSLNTVLNESANIDQTGRMLIQDIVESLCGEGTVAVVPTKTSVDPTKSASYEIQSLRVGKITQWYPNAVKVMLYNEDTGRNEEIVVPKRTAAIIDNPFYSVMNSPNSTFKRLVRKLNLLDVTDERTSSGKLDLIIQLPYVIKSDARKTQAEKRRKEIEEQLAGSKYGIAYTDGTEKITQLNRSIENNLMAQVTQLTEQLYNELGLSKNIFNGTANEVESLSYHNRTIEPFLGAICDAMKRSFLSKTARTQGHSLMYFKDPFKLVPLMTIANIADTFTRNAIMTSNEIRALLGMRPSEEPVADELSNKNLYPSEPGSGQIPEEPVGDEQTAIDQPIDDYGDMLESVPAEKLGDTIDISSISDVPIDMVTDDGSLTTDDIMLRDYDDIPIKELMKWR